MLPLNVFLRRLDHKLLTMRSIIRSGGRLEAIPEPQGQSPIVGGGEVQWTLANQLGNVCELLVDNTATGPIAQLNDRGKEIAMPVSIVKS